jgi:hypothetical protein
VVGDLGGDDPGDAADVGGQDRVVPPARGDADLAGDRFRRWRFLAVLAPIVIDRPAWDHHPAGAGDNALSAMA